MSFGLWSECRGIDTLISQREEFSSIPWEGTRRLYQHADGIPSSFGLRRVDLYRWIEGSEQARRLIAEGVEFFRFFFQYQEWNTGTPVLQTVDDVLASSGIQLRVPDGMGIAAI